MNERTDEKLRPVSVNLGEADRRALLARAAERSVAEGRPVSMSEVARELIRRAGQRQGAAA